jgi:uncharacterized membrane protein YoaK (UPF0700 family)
VSNGRVMKVVAEPSALTASPSHGPLPTPLLFALATVTGMVDAVCYLGLGHVFTANMTGNVVLLGFALAGVESLSISRSVTALAAFLLGAVLGVRLARSTVPSTRWPAAAFASEAALLLMSATVAGSLSVGASAASTAVYVVIALTGVAMGIRNATIRRLGEREVNTTVLTMTLTAIGSDSVFAGGSNQGALRRFGFVMSVLAGAAVGALLLRFSAALTLGIAGAGSIGCAAAAYLNAQQSSRT